MDTHTPVNCMDIRRRRWRSPRYASVTAVCVLSLSLLAACATDSNSADSADSADTADSGAPTASAADTSDEDTTTEDADGRCTTDDLDISLGQTQGAAGSQLIDLTFTNVSAAECSLTGYPGVALVDSAGEQLGSAAEREDTGTGSPVDLAPEAVAVAPLSLSRAENYGAETCDPVPAAGLQVIAPDETADTVLDVEATACADESVSLLSVQPLQSGT